MDNLESKMQNLLNSPDGINQILSIARGLMGNASAPETPPPESDAPNIEISGTEEAPPPNAAAESAVDTSHPVQSGGGDDILSVLGNLDPGTIQTVMGLIGEYRSADDRRFHLLDALRPYMKSADVGHIDKAMQIMRLSKVIRRAFSSNLGGSDAHV